MVFIDLHTIKSLYSKFGLKWTAQSCEPQQWRKGKGKVAFHCSFSQCDSDGTDTTIQLQYYHFSGIMKNETYPPPHPKKKTWTHLTKIETWYNNFVFALVIPQIHIGVQTKKEFMYTFILWFVVIYFFGLTMNKALNSNIES